MNMDDQVARVVEARMKLRERFLHDVEATPSIADDRQWAAAKIGAAILPKSKVTSGVAYPIKDLLAFEQHQRKVVPGIVRGVA